MAAPLQIVIEDDAGRRQVIPFAGDEITLGRAREGNTVCLAERNVSRRHARFLRANGAVFLEDLGSANGTHVNGERLAARRRIRPGDLVQIGDYDIALEGAEERVRGDDRRTAEVSAAPAPPLPPPLPGAARPEAPTRPEGPARPAAAALPAAPAPLAPAPVAAPPPRPAGSAAARRAFFLAAVAVASLLAGWAAGTLTRPAASAEAAAAPR